MRYIFWALFIFVILILSSYVFIEKRRANTMNTGSIQYGEIISFSQNQALQFPDFSIRYLGNTSKKFDLNPKLKFTYYNFAVTALDNRERTLRWSSGTGDIAPKSFVVGNKTYQLELKYVEKYDRRLTDNEMVISLSESDISKYLFQLIAGLSLLPQHDLDTLTSALGFSFKETESSNQDTQVFTSDGFSPISRATLHISRNHLERKLLMFEIDVATNISDKAILERYPDAQIDLQSPNDSTYTSFSVSKSWGEIRFGFNRNNILTNIDLDSTKYQPSTSEEGV